MRNWHGWDWFLSSCACVVAICALSALFYWLGI